MANPPSPRPALRRAPDAALHPALVHVVDITAGESQTIIDLTNNAGRLNKAGTGAAVGYESAEPGQFGDRDGSASKRDKKSKVKSKPAKSAKKSKQKPSDDKVGKASKSKSKGKKAQSKKAKAASGEKKSAKNKKKKSSKRHSEELSLQAKRQLRRGAKARGTSADSAVDSALSNLRP